MMKPDDFESDCSIVGLGDTEHTGERFDFTLPPMEDLVCIMDAECHPVCFVKSDRAEAVLELLNDAIARRQGLKR